MATMMKEEILRRANAIANPYGLKAEFLDDELLSVGVGGDNRTYTPIINLVGPHPGNEALEKISTEITGTLEINRVTIQLTPKL